MEGKQLTVTEPMMTRFLMSLDEAVELVIFAFENAEAGDIMVQKAPACTIGTLAQAVCELFHVKADIRMIGVRHGEKMHETLLTNEECSRAIDFGEYYQVPADNRNLNYDNYFTNGNRKRAHLKEFTSANTRQLDVEQVKEKLLQQPYVQRQLKKWGEK